MAKKKYHIIPDGYIPTKEEANKYIALPYSANPEVGDKKERALVNMFEKSIPKNKSFEDILAKCVTLNVLANTNIIDVFHVAKHIHELDHEIDIDERLKTGDYKLVNDISKVVIKGKLHHFYSFASKYCSYHQPNLYSIYDRNVALVLMELQKKDSYSNFNRTEDLRDYGCYMRVLEDFRKRYGLMQFSKKDLDKYLWLLGKEWVREYDKKK